MRRLLFSMLFLWVVGTSPAFSAVFDHAAHNGYIEGTECEACHVEEAPSIVPDLKVCFECHDQAFVDAVELPALDSHSPTWAFHHRVAAKTKAMDCSACHQQDFCLDCHKAESADEQGSFTNNMMNVHRSEFDVSHPIAARTDPQLCSSCHENKFCVECHERFAPEDLSVASHRRGWLDGTLGGGHAIYVDNPFSCQTCHPEGSVLPSSTGWSAEHAREARKNLATCQACHPEGEVCLRCHSAREGLMVNPHPDNWDDIADTLNKASGGRSCRKCH